MIFSWTWLINTLFIYSYYTGNVLIDITSTSNVMTHLFFLIL
jgi:hypothetical protein